MTLRVNLNYHRSDRKKGILLYSGVASIVVGRKNSGGVIVFLLLQRICLHVLLILILLIHLGSLSHSLLSFIFSLSSQICLQLLLKDGILLLKMCNQLLLLRIFMDLSILLNSWVWSDSFENRQSFDNIFID